VSPSRRRGTARGDAGFTLLEVIVALAILGTAVVASIQAFAGGLRLLKLAGDHQQAILLADQKMREVTVLEDGKEEGTEGPFTWERTIETQAAQETQYASTSTLGGVPSQPPGTPPGTLPGVLPSTKPGTTTGTPGATAGITTGASTTDQKWKVYRIDVKVRWERRSVELATLRTEPAQKPASATQPLASQNARAQTPQ